MTRPLVTRAALCAFGWCTVACGGDDEATQATQPWTCLTDAGETPDSLPELGCTTDFEAVAAEPGDSSLPGALSVKTIIDRVDDSRLYFQNTDKFPLHFDFASTHLSAVGDLPYIGDESDFNANYREEQRRFVLGAVTHYEGPDKWAYELSPYDTATPEMIADAYRLIATSVFFGDELYYHPSGESAEAAAKDLPDSVPVLTTDEIYEGTDFQPLTLGKSCGTLVFHTAEELDTEFVSYQDIVVLDRVPNDISVTQGIITAEFQTPLSHVNVLSQNRGTPNMGLKGAFDSEELRALEGEWVTLEVTANDWSIEASDPDDADDCVIKAEPIEITGMDLGVRELTDIKDIYDPNSEIPMRDQIHDAIPAFGGKASHYSALAYVEEANVPKAFAIPIYFYDQFMTENGFYDRVEALLEDTQFSSNAAIRNSELEELRDDMQAAPVNEDFLGDLMAKLEADFPGTRMRFRSSTNAEDLGDFTGAGLYDSESGAAGSDDEPVAAALKEVWASIWSFRAFEERAYRGIEHLKVGMAILSHRSFPEEEANGVAVTANPFDTAGVEPGFYVNVQVNDLSVVSPPAGVTTDQFIYYFDLPDKPVVFLEHSNLVGVDQTVLSKTQTYQLGVALKAIHQHFFVAYGSDDPSGWYAMDVEFKFDGEPDDDVEPQLYVKQARPYPGR